MQFYDVLQSYLLSLNRAYGQWNGTRDHPDKSYLAPGSRPGCGGRLGAALIRDSRTFFARSPRLPNRFQNFFFHMKAFLLKIGILWESIRSFLFLKLLGRFEVSRSVQKCPEMSRKSISGHFWTNLDISQPRIKIPQIASYRLSEPSWWST